MRKNVVFLAMCLVAGICFSQNQRIKIDFAGVKGQYGAVSVSPMDGGVTMSGNRIVLAPKKEEVTYTISGYFDGQIVNKTKNTVIKLKGAYLENTSGEAALYGEAKTEVSTSKGTVNYIVSPGYSHPKAAAVQCKKNIVFGGSGTLYVVGPYHGAKGDDVKIKGSGVFYFQGTEKGSGINCRSLVVEKDKNFTAYFLNSKNGIKADNTISIASGTFCFYDNGTAFKTDTSQDDPKEKHGILVVGGTIRTHGNKNLYATEKDSFKSRVKIVEE